MNYELILQIAIPLVATGLGFLLTLIFKTPTAEAFLKGAVAIVYPVVQKISEGTANTVDDKIALALKALNAYYTGQGKKLLPVDEEKAKALFKALEGAQK